MKLLAALICVATVAVLPSVVAADVSVRVTVDPAVIPLGGEASMTVTVEGKFRRSAQPELPDLDAFTIYQAGTSQSFTIVNGRPTSSLQFSYVIVARQEGTHTIEPVRFEVNNKVYTADPVTVEVVKSQSQLPPPTGGADGGDVDADDRPVFITAKVDRDTVYVNQQITWTLGFFTDGRIEMLRSPEFSPPTSEGFWVEDLPPQSSRYQEIDGRRYLVNEIKRGHFPTAPGEYTIGQARVDIVVDDGGSGRANDFFGRRLRSFGFGKPVSLKSDAVPITVLALPRSGRPANFSGLVGRNLKVSLRADKQVVEVGDPVNLTMEISGEGNFKTMAAPEVPEIDGFKIYESGSKSDLFKKEYRVAGRKKTDYVLIPREEGPQAIPAIRLSYFDPVARKYMTARSQSVQLEVQPGEQEEGRRVIFAGSGENIEVLGRDINYIHSVPARITARASRPYANGWVLALNALPLLAVVASLFVERRRRQWLDQGPRARAMRAAGEAAKRLGAATRAVGDGRVAESYSMVALALCEYAGAKMGVAAAGLTTDAIADFLAEKDVDEETIERMRSVLAFCDSVQYSGASADDAGQAGEIAGNARQIIRDLEGKKLS